MDESFTDSYDFFLPEHLIAKKPAIPADSAKLLVYDRQTKKITHTVFSELFKFLDNHTIFLNNTKVIKARVFGVKSTGGKIELLLNKPVEKFEFLVFIKGRVKIGDILYFENDLKCKILDINDDGTKIVHFFVESEMLLDFSKIVEFFEKIGHIPLPPYIDRKDEKSDEKDYQTLFAKYDGSVAAPTASLHFTPQMLESLEQKFGLNFITLHVGAGTFKPVEAKNLEHHKMHSEYYNIEENSVNLINSDVKILAVGTTVTRTIEYFYRTAKTTGECDLFLNPMNKPQRVDSLLTNFHLPKSSLIMLVASFVGLEKTMEIYKEAIKNNYRFYSYGDAMLII